MVKVLIVGATGFLGNLIAHQAVKEGHQVTALVRADTQSAKKKMVGDLVGAGVKIVTGSLESDQKQLVEVLKSVEAVRGRPIWFAEESCVTYVKAQYLAGGCSPQHLQAGKPTIHGTMICLRYGDSMITQPRCTTTEHMCMYS